MAGYKGPNEKAGSTSTTVPARPEIGNLHHR